MSKVWYSIHLLNRQSNIIKKIDDISIDSSTGFPQIEKIQDDLIIIYTESGPKEKKDKNIYNVNIVTLESDIIKVVISFFFE